MNIIGERIKKERLKRKLSIRNLALKINISHTTIARIERGETKPDANSTLLFADFFNVSTDYLLGRSDNKPTIVEKPIFHSLYKDTAEFKEIIEFLDNCSHDELLMLKGMLLYFKDKNGKEDRIKKVM